MTITPEMLAKSGSEYSQQSAVFCWSSLPEVRAKYPQLKWMHSSGNGIFTTSGHKAKEVAAGLKKGVWDIFLPVPQFTRSKLNEKYLKYCGLWVEMKVKNNQLTKEQAEFRNDLANYYDFQVCYTWEQARDAIVNYLEGK